VERLEKECRKTSIHTVPVFRFNQTYLSRATYRDKGTR